MVGGVTTARGGGRLIRKFGLKPFAYIITSVRRKYKI